MINTLSIIIPVFNEEKTIHLILNKIKGVILENNVQKEIIIVDDCSTDNSVLTINNYINSNPSIDIKLYKLKKNSGKGAALKNGFKNATGDYIIIQDADLEYDPEEYNLLLAPVFKDGADVVYGSRFIGGKPHRILFFGIV